MEKKLTKSELKTKLRGWATKSLGKIYSITAFGSFSKLSNDDICPDSSDCDILIHKSDSIEDNVIFDQLFKIGEECGVLLHPLLISDSNYDLKIGIKEYKDFFCDGEKIYRV